MSTDDTTTELNRPQPAQGWECPRCNTIHAPWVEACSCIAIEYKKAPSVIPFFYPSPTVDAWPETRWTITTLKEPDVLWAPP